MNDQKKEWYDRFCKIVIPVLDGFIEKRIKDDFPKVYSLHLHSNEKKHENTIYAELFCRTFMSISIFFQNESFINKYQLNVLFEKTCQALHVAFSGYIDFTKMGDQVIVEMANIAIALLRTPFIWNKIDTNDQKRIISVLLFAHQYVLKHSNNWILFKCVIAIFLYKTKQIPHINQVYLYLQQFEKYYIGDGWYKDGHTFHMDYYNSYVILPFLFAIYREMKSLESPYKQYAIVQYAKCVSYLQRQSEFLERLIHHDGTYPIFGRSAVYRCAIFHALVLSSYYQILPPSLTYGQVREALQQVIRRTFDGYKDGDYLSFGFRFQNGDEPEIADSYSNSGSVYYALLIFMPLGLEDDAPFWSDPPQSWTQKRLWITHEPVSIDRYLRE